MEYSYPCFTSFSLTATLPPAEETDNERSSKGNDCHDDDVDPGRSCKEVCKSLNEIKDRSRTRLNVRVERVDGNRRIGRCVSHCRESPLFFISSRFMFPISAQSEGSPIIGVISSVSCYP